MKHRDPDPPSGPDATLGVPAKEPQAQLTRHLEDLDATHGSPTTADRACTETDQTP